MTHLASFFVRTALCNLVVGFILGGWMLVAPAYGLPVPVGTRTTHVHFLVVGFFTCMVMGVAWWMFPAPPGEGRAGISARQPWGWWAYGLLVGGLVLQAVVNLAPVHPDAAWPHLVTTVGAVAEVLGAMAFAAAIWRRTHPRPMIPTGPRGEA